MRPLPEHRFVIANEEDFQQWLELVLEAERGRLREAHDEGNDQVAALFEGASRQKAQNN